MRKPLTDALVRSVTPPAIGRIEINDLRSLGLTLRVASGGSRTWCFRFRDPRSGKSVRSTIGSYPDLSLSDAREKADEFRKLVAKGTNPATVKRQERADADSKTFKYLAGRYMEEHARRRKRPKSIGDDDRNLRLHILTAWGTRRYDEIGRRDVIALVEKLISDGKPVLANRVQALTSSIFSFAIDADLVSANPASRLRKRGVERKVTRVLSDAELKLFWGCVVLPPVSIAVGLALRLALLTAMRAGEVAGLSRAEIVDMDDSERAAILIPAERSKNKRAHYVPLTPLAVSTVREAISLAGDSRHVFPSPTGSGAIDAHALATAMRRMADALPNDHSGAASWKAERPTAHDLRRTCATRLASLGVPGEDVSAVLGHTRQDVTGRHYDLYERAPEKRSALNVWATTLARILYADEVSNLVLLRRGP
jgi:integrase